MDVAEGKQRVSEDREGGERAKSEETYVQMAMPAATTEATTIMMIMVVLPRPELSFFSVSCVS